VAIVVLDEAVPILDIRRDVIAGPLVDLAQLVGERAQRIALWQITPPLNVVDELHRRRQRSVAARMHLADPPPEIRHQRRRHRAEILERGNRLRFALASGPDLLPKDRLRGVSAGFPLAPSPRPEQVAYCVCGRLRTAPCLLWRAGRRLHGWRLARRSAGRLGRRSLSTTTSRSRPIAEHGVRVERIASRCSTGLLDETLPLHVALSRLRPALADFRHLFRRINRAALC
jgi:hypothetical protein